MNPKTQAAILTRAVHTLEYLRDNGCIQNDESTTSLFAEHSWYELKELKKVVLAENGLQAHDIDIGADYVAPDTAYDLFPAKDSLLAALEQAEMDMEAFRAAMTAHDRALFLPCCERARAAIARATGGV